MEHNRKTPALKTVEKALDILDCVVDSPRAMTATEIAEKVGLSLSSVYKFLSTLVEKDYLYYNPDNKQYQISNRIFRFSCNLRDNQRLSQIALPFMQKLADATRETVHLAVPQGLNAVFIEKIDSPHTIGVQTRIGTVAPLYCGATPQAIMAYLPDNVFARLCSQTSQVEAADCRKLPQLREEIRRQGYAFTVGQMNAGVAALACPVFDLSGEVVGSIAVAAPQERFSSDQIPQRSRLVKDICFQVSQVLGYRGERF